MKYHIHLILGKMSQTTLKYQPVFWICVSILQLIPYLILQRNCWVKGDYANPVSTLRTTEKARFQSVFELLCVEAYPNFYCNGGSTKETDIKKNKPKRDKLENLQIFMNLKL